MDWTFKSRSCSRALRRAAGLGLLAAALLPAVPAEPVDYAVVASLDVPVEAVTSEDLRQLFMLRRTYWSTGRPVNLILPGPALEDGSFLLDEIYEMNYPSLRRMILELLYRGEINLAPKIVTAEADAVSFAESGRGVVTLVRVNAVKQARVRVLAVDGKRPGDAGYPLRR